MEKVDKELLIPHKNNGVYPAYEINMQKIDSWEKQMLFHPNRVTPPYTALLGSSEATPGETQTPTVMLVDADGRGPDPRALQHDPVSGWLSGRHE